MTPTDDNTNTTPVILTAIADDRPNLLEHHPHDHRRRRRRNNRNRRPNHPRIPPSASPSSSASPKAAQLPLRAALVGLTVQHNIKIHVDDMPDGALYRPTTDETK